MGNCLFHEHNHGRNNTDTDECSLTCFPTGPGGQIDQRHSFWLCEVCQTCVEFLY